MLKIYSYNCRYSVLPLVWLAALFLDPGINFWLFLLLVKAFSYKHTGLAVWYNKSRDVKFLEKL